MIRVFVSLQNFKNPANRNPERFSLPRIVLKCLAITLFDYSLAFFGIIVSSNVTVKVIRRMGVFYGDKDPRLEVDERVYFLTTREGSMILVNWKLRLQNTTK